MNNPQLVLDRAPFQSLDKAFGHPKNALLVLISKSEDYEAWNVRVGSLDVGEPTIEGNEDSLLRLADTFNRRIDLASEVFVIDRQRIPSRITEKLSQFLWQVFVNLELHAGSPTTSSRAKSAA